MNVQDGAGQATQSQVNQALASDAQLADDLCAVYFAMRDLLEDYAPVWYADELHERVDAVRQRLEAAT